jgi:hypothetical protein
MAVYKAAISIAADTALARDRMVITPHFKATVFPDADALANDLCVAMQGYVGNPSYDVDVKLYDAEVYPTGAPKGRKQKGTTPISSNGPREIALCLSFYADSNTKRRRGRVYIPHNWLYRKDTSPGPPGARPSLTTRTAAAAIVPIFTALGGVDVDWCVWSKADHAAHTVTNWYVDDEWDIQRRRGDRPTTRTTGTTSG